MLEGTFDRPPHLGHPLEDRERPARGEDVEPETGVSRMQQFEQGLGHHHVADPGRSDYQDLEHGDE